MARSSKRAAVLLVVAAIVALAVPPFINVNRYRARIADTISRSLSRPVTMGNISLRMLPQPHFVIQNLMIGDDPAFSAEPMLRSDEVTATLRITSLWRGRLEIAKLSFRDPSLNLVRDANDRWNFESLLNTAKQVPSAPTAKRQAETRPRFPYIEADAGRINFKSGVEKKAFALADADFALWQESENQWNVRLEARPIRTDANLGDTGTLRVEGSVQRAAELRESPVDVRVELERAQLGQFSHFLQGHDGGWRGDLHVRGKVTGTAEELRFSADADVDNFRRYDLFVTDELSLATHCEGSWFGAARRQQSGARDPQFARMDCKSPLGDGSVSFDASVTHDLGWRVPSDRLVISRVPMAAIGTMLRHAKANLPNDFSMSGAVSGEFTAGDSGNWMGGATVSDAVFRSAELKTEIRVPMVTIGYAAVSKGKSAGVPVLSVAPFHVALGTTGGADVSGNAHDGQATLAAKGRGDLPAVLNAARLLGLRTPKSQMTGALQFDVAVSQSLAAIMPPSITGSAKLQNVVSRVPGAASPLEIASADAAMNGDAIELRNMRGSIRAMQFDGGITWHRCEASPCALEFDLHANEINLDELNRLLNPALRESSWRDFPRRLFAGDSQAIGNLPDLHASGRLRADRVVAKSVMATNAVADVRWADGVLLVQNLQGELAGGRHSGEWRGDFSGSAPEYRGSGTLRGANAATLSLLFGSALAAGKADVTYRVTMAGTTATTLAANATGDAEFRWSNGSLREVPLDFKQWSGKLEFASGKATLLPSTVETAKGNLQARGEVSFPRELNLVLNDGAQSITIAGPLDKPNVSVRRAQAASNPVNAETNPNR